jgi:SAM-dependent methyltransferase
VAEDLEAVERAHQDAWYGRAVREEFFEREGFARLVAWNLEALRRLVPIRRDMRLLSVGCGMGDYELLLRHEVAEVVGFDLSSVAVAEAARLARAQHATNVSFVAGSYRDMTWPDATFDGAYAFGVLHHLSPDERAALVARLARWVKPGGWVYVRDPNARGLLRRVAEPFFRATSSLHSPNEGSLDPGIIQDELRRAGVVDLKVDHIDVLGGPLPWLVKSNSKLLWSAVFGFDRLWLATPGLRAWSSQFAVAGRVPPRTSPDGRVS